MTHNKQEIADQWAGESCWLDGQRAKVCGRLNQFATIAVLPDGYSCEFTWGQVDNVMKCCGGHFASAYTEVVEPYVKREPQTGKAVSSA